MSEFRKVMNKLKVEKDFCISVGWTVKAQKINSEMVERIHENTQKIKKGILWGYGMDKFFHDKNIILDILEEIERKENYKIINIYKNIYNDILTNQDISELTKYYPIILLDGYAKDRGQKFNILEDEGLKDLVKFIYIDRVKTVLKMVINKLGFNFYTDLNVKNKTLLKKELKKL